MKVKITFEIKSNLNFAVKSKKISSIKQKPTRKLRAS